VAIVTVIGKITTTFVVLALVGAGCGGGRAQPPFDVVSTVASHETTGQITVLEPQADGPWPVVYMLHGIGGNRQEMEQLGRTVAEQGNVVFTLDWDARQGMDAVLFDLACSYNYGQSVAPDHGGDPHRGQEASDPPR
jgi:poly(3-hydroxybutyrate) depolymerase